MYLPDIGSADVMKCDFNVLEVKTASKKEVPVSCFTRSAK